MPREYPEQPIVGVGAVVLKGAQVLVIRRANEPDRGRWAIPGGGVEVGETLAAAAHREVVEECGLDVRLGDVCALYDLILPDAQGRTRFHYILVHFRAYYQGGEPQAGSDTLEARWATWDEIQDLDMPDRVRRLIGRALSHASAETPDRQLYMRHVTQPAEPE